MSSARPTVSDLLDSTRGWTLTVVQYIIPLVVVLLFWQAVTMAELVPEQTLPRPVLIFDALTINDFFLAAAWLTLRRVVLAFGVAVVAAVIVGLLMAQFTVVRWFFDPIISVAFPIPKVTLVPIYVLWFGFGTPSVVALAATSAFFPAVIGTYNGAKTVQRELVWSARSMGLSRTETSLRVVLPAAMPEILNGAQISLFLSFAVVVVAEMVTAPSGIGRVFIESMRFFNTPEAIGGVVIIGLFGLVTTSIFALVQQRLLWWTE